MRYQPTDPRDDDPNQVMSLKDKHKGGVALIVLGGNSAKDWQRVREQVNPDIVLGANGVNSMVDNLDYWMIAENMKHSAKKAEKGDPDSLAMMKMFHRESGAKVKLVSHHSWNLLRNKENCIRIRRQGYEEHEIEQHFNFREYGLGYLAGWLLKHKEAGALVHVGTVAAQLLHHAGILGCREVHTIGLDLMFQDETAHHAYPHPLYKSDRYRNPGFKTQYKGVDTQWAWLESGQFLQSIEPLFERDGLKWKDHSRGLLSVMGLECTK